MPNHDPKAETAIATSATTSSEAPAQTRRDGARSRPEEVLHATSDSSAEGQQISGLDKFKIKCLLSARYHEDRESFFQSIHRFAMFFVVAFGTATISPLRERYPIIPYLTTLAGLIDLVLDVSGKARLHAGLRKQIYAIMADAEISNDLASLERRLVLVYADEPPTMYAVSALAYNSAMASFDRPRQHFIKMSWLSP